MHKLTPEKAEIIGLLCAEGCYVHRFSSYWEYNKSRKKYYFKRNKLCKVLEFYNKDMKLLLHLKKLLLLAYNYKANITKDNKIRIGKRKLIDDILSYTLIGHLKWSVPKEVIHSKKEVKLKFIRGYFDGDGTASSRIRFFSTNKLGLLQVSNLLYDLKFKHTFPKPSIKENRKPLYYIQVSETEKERFLNSINPVSKR